MLERAVVEQVAALDLELRHRSDSAFARLMMSAGPRLDALPEPAPAPAPHQHQRKHGGTDCDRAGSVRLEQAKEDPDLEPARS